MALTEDQEPEVAEQDDTEAAADDTEAAADDTEAAADDATAAADDTVVVGDDAAASADDTKVAADDTVAVGDARMAAGDDPFLPPPPPPRPKFIAALPTTPLAEGRYAYHQGDYATAVAQLQAVVDSDEYDEESRISAAYWRAEALARQELTPQCIDHFQAVYAKYARRNAAGHHLASAALRRADALRMHFDIIGGVEDE
jgi:TolA-binding protein